MKKTTKAVGYLRVSGLAQVDGDGLPRQRDAIRRYAKGAGLELVGEYRDAGVSGTKELQDREALTELFTRLQTNGIRVVLVERADRLARDLLVGEIILGQFRKLGARVIACDSGTELTNADGDPTRKLIRQVLFAMCEFEKAILVARLRSGRIKKRRATGRCEGVPVYGRRPGEAAVVARMRALRRKPRGGKRLSYAAIAARLNQQNVPTRTGKRWHAQTVRGILQRPTPA